MHELKTLLPFFRPYRRGMLLGIALVVVTNVFGTGAPYLVKLAIDEMEAPTPTYGRIGLLAGLVVAAAVLGGIAKYGMRELLNGYSRKIERDLRQTLFDHLLRLPAQFYDEWRTGDLMSRATNDILAVRQVAGPAIMYLVNTTAISLLGLGLMVWIDPTLTFLAMIPMFILPALVYYFGQESPQRFGQTVRGPSR